MYYISPSISSARGEQAGINAPRGDFALFRTRAQHFHRLFLKSHTSPSIARDWCWIRKRKFLTKMEFLVIALHPTTVLDSRHSQRETTVDSLLTHDLLTHNPWKGLQKMVHQSWELAGRLNSLTHTPP
ncbi:hypothetical protein Pst134EA_000586 [Puccinia striiformis f. sp. tritici]|uniref:hypothetical protein n=1 Tax=Puccinia striiformis f. sp. tritici TaxID=168172 RepID=UPI002007DAFC|nr:hypothetical protein Pst134EA_000586 [Puccinia striiformis f. sp. tritici]KAH9466740.1 hypothetical protein Pst134EB_001791 [Puccinia striiformis f. sp. tritici]KAH9473507.1 hypothetical protein Pst134EA_000586 [Puccinia striiformis f. sp. tritici]